jgi:putative ABC transport system substrate-binding protein
MTIGVGRRQFISGLGGAAAFWPLAARAQQPTMPVVGYMTTAESDLRSPFMAAYRQGLSETGYVEGKNVTIDYRHADGQYDQLPAIAADLVHRGVAVIDTTAPIIALAAKAATATIPIVFNQGSDPVNDGLVASLNRPGGNVTGVFFLLNPITPKRFELLHELLPNGAVIAVLANPLNANAESDLNATESAARELGRQRIVLRASTEREIDAAFAEIVRQKAAAVFINADAYLTSRREQIAAMALRYALPTSFSLRESVVAGGLMSYGGDRAESARQFGIYTGRMLKGDKPADVPVMQATKFELVINLRTAKVLGLEIPPKLLALADKVIE